MQGFPGEVPSSILKISPHVTLFDKELRPAALDVVALRGRFRGRAGLTREPERSPAPHQAARRDRSRHRADGRSGSRRRARWWARRCSRSGPRNTRSIFAASTPSARRRVTAISQYMLEGSYQALSSTSDGILLGSGVASRLGAKLDDVLGGRNTARREVEPQGRRHFRSGGAAGRQFARVRDAAQRPDFARPSRHGGAHRDADRRPGPRARGVGSPRKDVRLRRRELARNERQFPRHLPDARHDHQLRGGGDPRGGRFRHPRHSGDDRSPEDARHRHFAQRRISSQRHSQRVSVARCDHRAGWRRDGVRHRALPHHRAVAFEDAPRGARQERVLFGLRRSAGVRLRRALCFDRGHRSEPDPCHPRIQIEPVDVLRGQVG